MTTSLKQMSIYTNFMVTKPPTSALDRQNTHRKRESKHHIKENHQDTREETNRRTMENYKNNQK